MQKQWLLAATSTLLTLVVALGIIRWFAPGLLGFSADQQLLRSSREIPPFYENVFRNEVYGPTEFILPDPALVSRARPLFPDLAHLGPHDIIGFRNRNVPNKADIITIGDSQTYGNNAALEENWPSVLQASLFDDLPGRVYNMSMGSWGGVNYLKILESALHLQPDAIVVAFYTGNDAYTDFRNAYTMEEFAYLMPDQTLDLDDLPEIAPINQFNYPVEFADGFATLMTPDYRLASNDRDLPAVRAGYSVMAQVAAEISARAIENGTLPIFTIIPTKELVYSDRVRAENIEVSDSYSTLVEHELLNIEELASAIAAIPNAHYVNVLTALQEAASAEEPLYLGNGDGHPTAAGYQVIGNTIGDHFKLIDFTLPQGLYALYNQGVFSRLVLITDSGMWRVEENIATANGWDIDQAPEMSVERVTGLDYLGNLEITNPALYGPGAFR